MQLLSGIRRGRGTRAAAEDAAASGRAPRVTPHDRPPGVGDGGRGDGGAGEVAAGPAARPGPAPGRAAGRDGRDARRGLWTRVAFLSVCGGLCGGLLGASALSLVSSRPGLGASPAPSLQLVPTPALADSPAVAVAREVGPAVVAVVNQSVTPDLFGAAQIATGTGSGIVFDPRGYVVTNDHVVAGAQRLQVVLADGTRYPASLVGASSATDLAVIRIHPRAPLPAAAFADSSRVVTGEVAIAIGNPLGLDLSRTVTVGVVSGIRRMLYGMGVSRSGCPDCRVTEVIQTDAAINPGNSGGPLCNTAGQVIGITSFKSGQAEPGVPSEGIGFAIPSNTVRRVVTDIMAYGHVRWPWLGIEYRPASGAGAGLAGHVVVAAVTPGGPAARAGLRAGDAITALDGTPVRNAYDLVASVSDRRPGERVDLTVSRDGRTLRVPVVLGTEPRAG